MYVTEEEARRVWCPEVRTAYFVRDRFGTLTGVVGGVNREGSGNESCLGSKCMMWREAPSGKWKSPGHPTGYCGKAGRPE